MQRKTIKKVLKKKLEEWLVTIEDVSLRDKVRKKLFLSGGSISSLFLDTQVNDYDIYLQDMDVLVELAKYYCPGIVLDGRKKGQYEYSSEDNSEASVRIRTLKRDQVKLNIASSGSRKTLKKDSEGNLLKYQVAFLSQNAISLTDDIQIVLRFSGTPEEIHKNFDFVHATNYYTHTEGLVTNIEALECLLSKTLRYKGSIYPLTSIIRMKKFILRGWSCNAGEMLKMMFQISELDLTNIDTLEEQLVGVDIAYFSTLIEVLRGENTTSLTALHLAEIIDKIFNESDDGK